jgi:hypothetical protein
VVFAEKFKPQLHGDVYLNLTSSHSHITE